MGNAVSSHLDLIADSILDGVFLLENGEVLYTNHVGERILGMPLESLSGRKIEELTSAPAKAIHDAMLRGIPIEISLEFSDDNDLDGSSNNRYYLIQANPVADKFNSAEVLIVAQDITIMKESEEAKRHFLATLSHEIKTPVTSLTMATRLLKRSIDLIPDANSKALVETCVREVDRLRQLIDEFLSASSEPFTRSLSYRELDLAKLLNHAIHPFKLQAMERGIALSFELIKNGKSTVVSIDPGKISWAFSNLLINALRHTPKGGVIVVKLEAKGDWLEVGVKDSGSGIEQKRKNWIFEKFNRFYDIRDAQVKGIGVGLALAREMIMAHKGRIWVNSEPGKGCEFCFMLPCKQHAELKTKVEGDIKNANVSS